MKKIVKKVVFGFAVICALIFAFNNARCFAEEGLAAYWSMDEGQGDVIKDKSGNGNDGKIHEAAWVEGKSGKALKFDGIDDYIDCGNDSSLNITDAITIEAWVYNCGSTRYEHVVSKRTDDNPQYGLTKTNTNKIMFEYGKVYGEWTAVTGNDFPLNRWAHVAVTVKDMAYTFYIDGQPAGSGHLSNAIPSMPYTPVIIGLHDYAYHRAPWNGLIDEVKIYNRALSREEIDLSILVAPVVKEG